MTEDSWLECSDPMLILEFLRGKASDRKMRLFACACCRTIWSLIVDERWRRAVEAAEEYADQRCSREQLQVEWDAEGVTAVGCAIDGATATDAGWGAAWTAKNVVEAISDFNQHLLQPPNSSDIGTWLEFRLEHKESSERAELAIQTNLLRDIFGNAFRAVTFDPSSRTLNVVSLAHTIYDNRSFDKMPELGDALERAGCRDQAILNHCRQPGEHIRGCWVVDLVLGEE